MSHALRCRAVPAVLSLVVACGLLSSCLTEDRFVRLSVENPIPYDVRIDVTGADRKLWLPVTTARRNSTTQAQEVRDVGPLWIFRFHAQAVEVGELQLTRAELVRSKWHLAIPGRIGDSLRAKGVPPAP